MWDLGCLWQYWASIAMGLCFVTSQFKLLLWIWQVKRAGTKMSSSAVCVPVVFVFNTGFNTDTQEERGILPKDPEEMELLPQVRSLQERWALRCVPVCSILCELALAWLSALWVVFCGGALISPCQQEAKAASGFTPCSTKLSKQNTVSPNCQSWNYLWTWPLESEPQTSLITFGDLCTGYHGDENNIWNSSLV